MSGTWPTLLLAIAPLVVVGMGLAVAGRPDLGPRHTAWASLRRWQPVAAIFAGVSLVPAQGVPAALLAVPWSASTIAAALVAAGRLLSRPPRLTAAMAVDAGVIYLAVGGVWLLADRAGWQPLGVPEHLVLLTAVHFHYAGFALPVVAGAAATRLGCGWRVPIGIVVGVAATATGILVGGIVESVTATGLAIAGLCTAVLLGRTGREVHGAARPLLVAAGVLLGAGMLLAVGWAWSDALGWRWLNIGVMARTHGTLNALGVGLFALLGLLVLPPGHPDRTATIVHLLRPPRSRLHDLWRQATGDQLTSRPELLATASAPGHERFSVERSLDSGDLDRARRAFAIWAAQGAAGITLEPSCPSLVVGSNLALVGPLGPFSFTATCRVTEVIDEADRVGFIYTTLGHHPEVGSESFTVTRQPDGSLVGAIEAVWRPAVLATAWCRPLTRWAQRRYARRYLDGLARHVHAVPDLTTHPQEEDVDPSRAPRHLRTTDPGQLPDRP